MNASNQSLIRHLEQKLGLLFEEAPSTHNLCFANQNSGLRNDFKRVFTPADLYYYTRVTDYFPESTEAFWQRVEEGKQSATGE